MMTGVLTAKGVISIMPKALSLVKRYFPWFVIIALPVGINLLVWALWLSPPQDARRTLMNAKALLLAGSNLEESLGKSGRLIHEMERSGFLTSDPITVIDNVQKIAAENDVRIVEVRQNSLSSEPKSKNARVVNGLKLLSVTLMVEGSYENLARWMSVVEKRPNLKLGNWILRPNRSRGEERQLAADIKIFTREM